MLRQACRQGSSRGPWDPGDGWEVSDVWSEEREGAQDELHVRVAHRKGQAPECCVLSTRREQNAHQFLSRLLTPLDHDF